MLYSLDTVNAPSAAPLPPPDLPQQCPCCGAVLTSAEWAALPYVGLQDDFEGGWLELRNHVCGSTLARVAT